MKKALLTALFTAALWAEDPLGGKRLSEVVDLDWWALPAGFETRTFHGASTVGLFANPIGFGADSRFFARSGGALYREMGVGWVITPAYFREELYLRWRPVRALALEAGGGVQVDWLGIKAKRAGDGSYQKQDIEWATHHLFAQRFWRVSADIQESLGYWALTGMFDGIYWRDGVDRFHYNTGLYHDEGWIYRHTLSAMVPAGGKAWSIGLYHLLSGTQAHPAAAQTLGVQHIAKAFGGAGDWITRVGWQWHETAQPNAPEGVGATLAFRVFWR